ncbi:hypothetical protein SLS60_004573 [Paraconiothyrium brasiliense]|uniref:Uncharacterized protein n=1 Tax=Paraconiothyrium brasiliense TaxID=300254 RepID=A0ABR3RKQ7_9PLEO
MAASLSDRDLNPTVEDYHSDDSEDPVLESFRRSPAANVAAKRSHPSDLGTDKPQADKEKGVHIDLQSDSGYSSHTAGTMSSADSVPSAKMSQTSTAPSSAASMPPPSPATSRRRPTVVEDRRKPTESPRKPLQRNNSTASKQRPAATRRPTVTQTPDERDDRECRDPNCTTCGPNARPPRRGRRESLAVDSGLDLNYPPFDVRSQRSDPAPSTYTSPPSPTYNRQPAPYRLGSTMVQPAQTRPRVSSTARRPMSYHGDPGSNYYVPGMPAPYPSPPQDFGPPPSMSAQYSMPQPRQHHPQMPPFMMGTPPSNFYQGDYQGGHPMAQAQAQHMSQTSPPYEQQRPSLSARNPPSFHARRPVSGFGPAMVTYENNKAEQMPSARYGNAPQSARQERFPMKALKQTAHDDSESSEEYESSSEEEVPIAPPPKQLMPPPQLKSKSKKEQRPVLRHAKTTQVTQVYNDRRERRQSVSQSQMLPERPRERDNKASRVNTAPASRSISKSRPGPPKRATQSAYDTPHARVLVENPRTSRRQSVQAYDRAYEPQYEDEYDSELEERRRRRRSKVYRGEEEDAILVTERPPRRRTDSIKRSEYLTGRGRETAQLVDDVEAYQQRTRGTYEPLTEQVHKVAKQRASRVPSDPDRKTRISQSARTTVTNGNNNGEIRLRVDASAPLSLSFNGDMEGRTLQINPAEDGMADIVIGGQRGEDGVYRSEKGSVRGSRNSMLAGSARREAEEVSVKSGRSSQGRREREVESRRYGERDRDAERRPLRREIRQTRYH